MSEDSAATEIRADWAPLPDEQGRTYWWNERTGASQWEKAPIRGQYGEILIIARRKRRRDVPCKDCRINSMVEEKDEHGNVYYFNSETQESQWDRPTFS